MSRSATPPAVGNFGATSPHVAQVINGQRQWAVQEGHVLDELRRLPEESVQCVVTSPPYWGLRDYAIPPQVWGGSPKCVHQWGRETRIHRGGKTGNTTAFKNRQGNGERDKMRSRRTGRLCRRCNAWRGSLGLEPTIKMYLKHIVLLFRQVRRVLRRDGTLFLNMGDSYSDSGRGTDSHSTLRGTRHNQSESRKVRVREFSRTGLKPKQLIGLPWRVAFALQEDGWWLRRDIVWSKPNPIPESARDRPTGSHEYVFLMSKRSRYFFDAEAIKCPASPNTHARVSQEMLKKMGPKFYPYEKPSSSWQHGFGAHDQVPTGRYTQPGVGPKTQPVGSGVRNNGSFSQAVVGRVITRNERTVWTIPTEAFSGKHFATFPRALVERCILAGTSAAGACQACGAPWWRSTSTGYANPGNRSTNGPRSVDRKHKEFGSCGYAVRLEKFVKTLGWKPSCECPPANPIPCIVLDPFGGSGTTALVARHLGRRAIVIELSREYCKMARERIQRGYSGTLPKNPNEALPLFKVR